MSVYSWRNSNCGLAATWAVPCTSPKAMWRFWASPNSSPASMVVAKARMAAIRSGMRPSRSSTGMPTNGSASVMPRSTIQAISCSAWGVGVIMTSPVRAGTTW